MAGMVVSASSGVLSSLLSKLSVLLSDHYKQRKGVRRDIELLSSELTYMNAALEKLADMEKLDGQTKVWRDNVREMGYDIEDCIDIFMHRLGQEEDDDDKDGLFHKIARKIKELRLHYQLANKIQELRTRAEEHSLSRGRYKIDESISQSRVVEVDPRLRALFEDAKRLVGTDGPLEEITKLLMDGDTHSGHLKVVSIVGFGGLGKTTLAYQVHTKMKNWFECTAFVSVSRTPDMPNILKGILSKLGNAGMGMEDNVQKLIEMLRAQLSNKRYLVIIDDLWSTKDWRTIECAFVENNNGSRVITTTRIQDVATACCFQTQGHKYQMQPLNELHSRRLFFRRLFYKEDGCPELFREISDDMLRKCKGVPLAITSIASLLSNHMHVESWEKIHNSLGSELDTNPTLDWMRHVLNLSYNDLSHELKTCLLYLGGYPEDHAIRKNDLVRKWIAEGFVQEKHGVDLEETAENCFNELINRSMIQPCLHPFSGEVWGCRVHDLMLDLVILKCKDENFITIIDRKSVMNGATQVRRISHQFNQRDMDLAAEGMSLSQIRSYNSFHLADCMPPFSKFELLRVLDMERGTMPGPKSMYLDLSAINHLFVLRYLRVSRFLLGLPMKFGKLKQLITLDMALATLLPASNNKSVSDFTSLSSLRHLRLPIDFLEGVTLTNGLCKLCNLRTLSRFTIRTNSLECIRDLGELTNLRELGVVYSRPDDMEGNLDTILAASLDKLGKSKLVHLVFEVRSGAIPPSTQFWRNCLTRPQHLQRFCLDGMIHKGPNWMVHANRLAYLYRLEVQELPSDDIQVLAHLPCLIYLWLIAKTIPEKSIIIHPNTLPSLKDFHFSCELACLKFETAAMPQLQRLDIRLDGRGHGAMQLQEGSPVCGIEHLASLVKIEITVEIFAKYDHGSQIEAACRDAISRHRKIQAMQIHVSCNEFDENGFVVARHKGTAEGISGEGGLNML